MKSLNWGHKLLRVGVLLLLMPATWQCVRQTTAPSAPLQASPVASQPQTPQQKYLFSGYDTPPTPVVGIHRTVIHKTARDLNYIRSVKREVPKGATYLDAVIQSDGLVGDVKVVRSAGDDERDQAAILALKGTFWNPALKNGKPVAAKITIPVMIPARQDD